MLYRMVGAATFGVSVCLTFMDFVGRVARVEGISMQPTLNPNGDHGDYVFLSRWSVRRRFDVQRGDIVAVVSPKEPGQKLIKRVVAMAGDRVLTLSRPEVLVHVPAGHCWLEGDNHARSLDSNLLGPVPLALVEATATHIVWPPSRVSKLVPCLPHGRILHSFR